MAHEMGIQTGTCTLQFIHRERQSLVVEGGRGQFQQVVATCSAVSYWWIAGTWDGHSDMHTAHCNSYTEKFSLWSLSEGTKQVVATRSAVSLPAAFSKLLLSSSYSESEHSASVCSSNLFMYCKAFNFDLKYMYENLGESEDNKKSLPFSYVYSFQTFTILII